MAAGGDGTSLRLFARRAGAPLRPQPQLGLAAAGAGGVVAGSDPAASARRETRGASGDEVSGAGGASQRWRLLAHGGRFRCASLRHATSRATVHGLAQRHARRPRTHSRRAGTVLENAATGTHGHACGGRTSGARSGHGDRHPATCRKAACRSAAGDDWCATETSARPVGKCAPGTQPDGGTNRKGAGAETC